MVLSASSYLAGNRVYNGGTNNPTSGTVDPSGYISRTLNQSNRRSGLAATALRTMQQKSPTTTPVTAPIQPISAATHQVIPNATGRLVLTPLTTHSSNPPGVTNNPPGVNSVLPFDPQAAAQQLQLQQKETNQLDSLNQLRQQLSEGITNKERNLDIAEPGALRNVLNNYAGRGMAYSSGYGYSYGQKQNDFANQKAELERQLQEGLANYDAQQQQYIDDYNAGLSGLQTSTTETQGQNPDSYIGLSGPQVPPKHKPKPKPTHIPTVRPPTVVYTHGKKKTIKGSTQKIAQRIIKKKAGK